MKLAIGADHAGFPLKQAIVASLPDVAFVDVGTHSTESTDYPDYAVAVAEQVLSGAVELGVLVCGTGAGMSMAANKIAGIRAACCSDTYTARLTRSHNDANVLCVGARVVGDGLAIDIVTAFMETSYSGGERHQRRLDKIAGLEATGCGV